MIKVALLHFWFADYTIALANSLIEYVDLTLIHPEHLSACQDLLDSRISVLTFKKPRLRDPRNLIAMGKMLRLIQEVQPDVLHVQASDPWYDLTLFLNSMPPLVTTVHDVFRHPGDFGSLGFEYTRRVTFHRSQHLIVHAHPLKAALVNQFHVPLPKINVLPHGELGSLYLRQASSKCPPRESYTLLFFGRIWRYKGLSYLIQAMSLVAERIPKAKLIIAGQGEDLGRYFPSGYDNRRYEILNDFIPPEAVAGLFQRSVATVLPYIESSQSGVAALSYGLGTPVIASDVGGLHEIVRHERDGLLVPPRDVQALTDAIVRLLSDRELQYQMQKATLARCQDDLNWSKIAAQTVEVYQKVCF